MTKEDWNIVKEKWSLPYAEIKLKIDGYEVMLEPVIYKLKLVHQVYVNGWMKGEFLNEKSEEGRRFYRPITKYVYSPLDRKNAVKNFGKRAAKKYGFDRTMTFIYPYWLSFTSFKRHIEANNKNIEFINE